MTSSTFLSTFAEKEVKRFKLKIGVFLFLFQKDQILLLRRHRTGIDDGKYVVPMGCHDGNEPLTSAVIREAYEEANITLQTSAISVCHVMHRWHPMPDNLSFEQVDLFFRADTYEGTIMNAEPDKCDELKFYPVNDLPANMAGFVSHALDCTLKGEVFSEYGWGE